MTQVTAFLFCSAAVILVAINLVPVEAGSYPAKKYAINLDIDPEMRWKEIAKKHSSDFRELALQMFQFAEAFVPKSLIEMILKLNVDLVNDLPYPYGAELLGISQAVNLSGTELLFVNLVYELTGFSMDNDKEVRACTSIVAQTDNGTIYHARNFDYLFTKVLKEITAQVDFMENGKVLYTGTVLIGYVGLLTGQRPNQFSVTLNQRNKGKWWMNLLQAMTTGTHGSASLLIRDVLANPLMDFKLAVTTLSSTPLIASSYIIVAGIGPNEGVVITRGRPRATDMWWLGSNHTWFLLETNYDHWESVPSFDDRRGPGHRAMLTIGQANLTASSLHEVLSQPPVHNSNTIFSTVMCPGKPEVFNTLVWN